MFRALASSFRQQQRFGATSTGTRSSLLTPSFSRGGSRLLSDTPSVEKKVPADADGIVVGMYQSGELSYTGKALDEATKGELRRQLTIANFKGKVGQVRVVWGLPGMENTKIAVVSLRPDGIPADYPHLRYSAFSTLAASYSGVMKLKSSFECDNIYIDPMFNAKSAAEGAMIASYTYNRTISKKPNAVQVHCLMQKDESAVSEFAEGIVTGEAQNMACDWAETPANIITPSTFCNEVTEKLSPLAVEVQSHDAAWIQSQKMGGLLGVSQGSSQQPRFLTASYMNSPLPDSPPVVLVGKGVTFDSGGISLKPGHDMGLMRGDMAGAASVMSTLWALAKLQAKVNVVAVAPLCENMPSANALKPGDVITTMKGITVEVDNTDAEGRLILADALHYASQTYKPYAIIDVATLTGAVVSALGGVASGVWANNDDLFKVIAECAKNSCEPVWRMPLFPEYRRQLESKIADINNVGGMEAGSSTAAMFLKEFVECKRWAHMDIAGTAQSKYKPNSNVYKQHMTGRPTRLLVELASELSDESCKKHSKEDTGRLTPL